MQIVVAKWLALLTSDHEIPGSNPADDRIQLMTVWSFIITLSLSRYDLNNVERDVKHQISIIHANCFSIEKLFQLYSLFRLHNCALD